MVQQTVINARKRLIKARKVKSREKKEEKFTRLLRRGKGFGVNEITNTTSSTRRSMNTIFDSCVHHGGFKIQTLSSVPSPQPLLAQWVK